MAFSFSTKHKLATQEGDSASIFQHLPNIVTVLGAIIGIFCACMYNHYWLQTAADFLSSYSTALPGYFSFTVIPDLVFGALYGLAWSTDGLDGYLARKGDWVSELGQKLDPVRDKILIAVGIYVIIRKALTMPAEYWITAITISIATLVAEIYSAIHFLKYTKKIGYHDITNVSKKSTLIQGVMFALLFLPLPGIIYILAWTAVFTASMCRRADYRKKAIKAGAY